MKKPSQPISQIVGIQSVCFSVIFLLKDKGGQSLAQELQGRFVKGLLKQVGIQKMRVFRTFPAGPQTIRADLLRNLKDNQRLRRQVFGVSSQGAIAFCRLSFGSEQKAVEGKIQFQDGKMVEVFADTVHGKEPGRETLVTDLLNLLNHAAFIKGSRVDLPDPAAVSVTGCAEKHLRM